MGEASSPFLSDRMLAFLNLALSQLAQDSAAHLTDLSALNYSLDPATRIGF